MGFIRFILIIAIIYYSIMFIARYIFPYLIKLFIKKQQSKFNPYYNQKTNPKKEGSVKVERTSKNQQKRPKQDKGEYIDFEEIKD